MSGPPQHIEPSQLWLKLQTLPRPFKLVDFPRRDPVTEEPIGQLAMRILTQEEQMICMAAAEEFARKHLKDSSKKDSLGYDRLYSDAVCVEVLFRACRDADDPTRPAFPTPKQIREQLNTEECGKLFEHYLTVQMEIGPTRHTMSDEELEAWIDRLVEGGSAFPFDLLSSDLQKIVLLHMASLLRSSPTDSSSVISPPEESTSDSSERPEPSKPDTEST